MDAVLTKPASHPTLVILALIAVCLLMAAILAGVTLWTIEHYMDITPADWPPAGGFWDVANDYACGLILLPGGTTGRFCYWLVFFPVPILIESRNRYWQKAVIYFLCVALPFSYNDTLFDNPLANDALSSVLVLVLALIAPLYLIQSWAAPAGNDREKKLIRAVLILIWFLFLAGDILLGLNVHQSYCKPGLTRALSQ